MEEMTKLSDTTLRRILHNHLGMHEVSAGWVPKQIKELCRIGVLVI